ncbi:MAG: HAD-IIIC family phosphatase [Magnetococcales bacterium]|nr:HAD-IIIC family phosphatase [Magnetococcales bacterium]
MFEFHQNRNAPPQSLPSGSAFAGLPVSHASFMVWGEHCVECAAPNCFSTCDLYQPRPDGRCRRFQEGLVPVTWPGSFRGQGAAIAFRKWGKLEARGNTTLEPVEHLVRLERLAHSLARGLDALGWLIHTVIPSHRWQAIAFHLLEKWNRRLHTREKVYGLPEAFLLECFNPATRPIHLHLAMGTSRSSLEPAQRNRPLPPPFTARLTLPPGFSRHLFERRLFNAIITSQLPFDITLIPEEELVRLTVLTADLVLFDPTRPHADSPPKNRQEPVKCLVWDLDNTLWDGILLEKEPEALRPGVREVLRILDERGILHAIASKNDHDHAWATLERLGVADYFLCPRIDWTPKSASMADIAKALNIGIDSLAFIDDSPFEREEVGRSHPRCTIRDAAELDTLLADPLFAGSSSEESRQRRQFYKDALAREQVRSRFGDDYLGFLASCDIQLTLSPFREAFRERVEELSQRTNQLNFSGAKYTRETLEVRLQDPALEKHVLSCSDRFGRYGVVGFALTRLEADVLHVEEFMLSCRVQGKFLEQALLADLLARHAGIETIRVDFRPTARNTPARQTLEAMGFEPHPEGGMVRRVDQGLDCPFIHIEREEANPV